MYQKFLPDNSVGYISDKKIEKMFENLIEQSANPVSFFTVCCTDTSTWGYGTAMPLLKMSDGTVRIPVVEIKNFKQLSYYQDHTETFDSVLAGITFSDSNAVYGQTHVGDLRLWVGSYWWYDNQVWEDSVMGYKCLWDNNNPSYDGAFAIDLLKYWGDNIETFVMGSVDLNGELIERKYVDIPNINITWPNPENIFYITTHFTVGLYDNYLLPSQINSPSSYVQKIRLVTNKGIATIDQEGKVFCNESQVGSIDLNNMVWWIELTDDSIVFESIYLENQ